MSHEQSQTSTGDQSPLLDSMLSSKLDLDREADSSSTSVTVPEQPPRTPIILSTESEAARKLGTTQLIPKNLAVTSRPKNRHHTTVVTLPVVLEAQKNIQRFSHDPSASWEDYDSDDGGLRRNRRNKSYRAAVTSLDADLIWKQDLLQPFSEEKEKTPSPKPVSHPGRKRTLGRRRRQKHGGSFKDDPRLYQEIKERGLQSNNLGPDDDFNQLPEEDQGIVMQNYKAAYMTWSQLPQVKEMGILESMSPEERKRQEAIFEIMTSEYSYLHSLGILVHHFKNSEALRKTLTATEHHHLFSNISTVHDISKRFFEDLERRHQMNPVIKEISDIVQDHATNYFEPYIVYCSNETFQQRTLQKLLASNIAFKEVLKQIESSPECGALPMISFLILPMQRVTRLPLLMDTICQKTTKQTTEYYTALWALKSISKLVKSCNDGARRMERTEQMYTIQKQMDFGKIKPFPLVSSSRWLLKRGELAVCTEELGIFWKAFSHKSYYLFLFNDVLIVTKKKSEESYVVFDYATLRNVEVAEEQAGKLYLRLEMKPNSEGRCDQMALVAESKLDRARWVTALHWSKQGEGSPNKDELPQYESTKAHMPKEPDELSLQQAEVVIVLEEVEGWCYGERMRDGERGWFPASCATQITNRTAIENNIQRMERLRKETNV
ncbi:rho guanine nucleotide exchange factor 16 [Neoarius graeffei]|uniref:rho guanine nucleotide exchange factor 16 n=1 Tax=Neoarius graeffei TaxID=443677 RepID=UPI00298BF1E6|nr:rho guanine nucleotide exchange factor 16 [Neoarius graeffei]XP_060787518.1 rho guanine nucleotide exchange factor 16 [Neoarius graeffei]